MIGSWIGTTNHRRYRMAIAIGTTLLYATPSFGGFVLIVVGLAIGGGIGAVIAKRIAMTAMPQLVAACLRG